MFGECSKNKDFKIQRCCLRDSIHCVNEVEIQARRKGRLKRSVYNFQNRET